MMFKSVHGQVPIHPHVRQVEPHKLDLTARTAAKQDANVRDIVRTKLQRRTGGQDSEPIKGTSI